MSKWFFKKKASKEDKERAKRNPSPEPERGPYKRSDGYWYKWVNDGRGGYDQILPQNEQNRLNYDGGR